MDGPRIGNRRIEEAALRAWPAAVQILLDGWVVRISEGYTGRANSVTPLYAAQMPPDSKIEPCERLYAEHGLPCRFRMTTAVPDPHLDALLARRGYARVAPTAVLTREVTERDAVPNDPGEIRERSLVDWLDLFSRLKQAPPLDHARHGRILAAVPGAMRLVVRSGAGRDVACGMAVLGEALLGLFDLVTDPAHRRRGHARALAADLLAWGARRGARLAYLQVMRDNAPALRLYEKLGFREAYGYWYRVPPGTMR
ncbi:MAG: GNAT family N-acetyltransferase [Candidatus Eisenbacteria bacterium]|nr:GNAT family N-acetyltransferase [Candidatus Eisenbacteria bacterium]